MKYLGFFLLLSYVGVAACAQPSAVAEAWSANWAEIRNVAAMIPGKRATSINMLKFAESHRPKNFSVQGAPAIPSVQARTVFQVVFADGYLMIDSGMDREVAQFFSHGAPDPYDQTADAEIQTALRGANAIIATHEHGDHVAGVIRSPFVDELAPKTVLTTEQIKTLETDPQMPEIKLTPEMASHYIELDYRQYYPFAPGIALIKAPGHTPGSQMIYVVLQSGREYLFIGDVVWHMDGIRQVKGKDAPWIKEDQASVMSQLRWLNALYRREKDLVIVASHDDEEQKALIAEHLLGSRLELQKTP